jgi:S1-C subfamily serine protease
MGALVYFEEEPGQALKLALVVVLTVLINVVSAAAQAAGTVSGSGVIISVKGEILTNDHVVGSVPNDHGEASFWKLGNSRRGRAR